MGQFQFTKTGIEGLVVVEPKVFGDNRGYFMETYNYNDFKAAGLDMVFVQHAHGICFYFFTHVYHLNRIIHIFFMEGNIH